uniref:Secreted protein n=1 Tax=Ascaris lumbricoides TaxID=6252 RepID=A0A0M3IGZ6_ASCLU
MKIVALLAIASLVWSARQPGKENDAEDQMPETIWIGSPYGLIPYDIDWAYFNKTKEHVLREADKQRKGIKAHPSETTTAAISRKGSNEKQEIDETLEDILSTTTIEPITTLQSTTCNDEQEDTINEQFHTTEATTQISESEAAMNQKNERARTSSLNHANIASISHVNRTHRQRIPHKSSTITSRISQPPTTPSATQRTFPRIPYKGNNANYAGNMKEESEGEHETNG